MKTIKSKRRNRSVSFSGLVKSLLIMCCIIMFMAFTPRNDSRNRPEVVMNSKTQEDEKQPITVIPGLWVGEDVQFYVSQDGAWIEGEDWSFEATVYFPEGNPLSLNSTKVQILIPIEIKADGCFHIKGGGTVIDGQFTSSSGCSGIVEHTHSPPLTNASATGTLKWTAMPEKIATPFQNQQHKLKQKDKIYEDGKIGILVNRIERANDFPDIIKSGSPLQRYPSPEDGYDYVIVHFTIDKIRDIHVVGFGGRDDEKSILHTDKGTRHNLTTWHAQGWEYLNPKKITSPSKLVEGGKGIMIYEIPKKEYPTELSFVYYFKETWDDEYNQKGKLNIKFSLLNED